MKTKPALKYFKCEFTDKEYKAGSYPILGLFIEKGRKTYLTRKFYKDGHFEIPRYKFCDEFMVKVWTHSPYEKTYLTYEEYVLESL